MHYANVLVFATSLLSVASAHKQMVSRNPFNGLIRGLSIKDTCFTGATCAGCFGAGYIDCGTGGYWCYNPGEGESCCSAGPDGFPCSDTQYCSTQGDYCCKKSLTEAQCAASISSTMKTSTKTTSKASTSTTKATTTTTKASTTTTKASTTSTTRSSTSVRSTSSSASSTNSAAAASSTSTDSSSSPTTTASGTTVLTTTTPTATPVSTSTSQSGSVSRAAATPMAMGKMEKAGAVMLGALGVALAL